MDLVQSSIDLFYSRYCGNQSRNILLNTLVTLTNKSVCSAGFVKECGKNSKNLDCTVYVNHNNVDDTNPQKFLNTGMIIDRNTMKRRVVIVK